MSSAKGEIEAPLTGVRVLEVATHVFVPTTGSVLAEWGADVVKVESRDGGDPYRALATFGLHNEHRGVDPFFQSANRGKRSVAVDLKKSDGRKILSRLIAKSDVFLTNIRAGARRRLRIEVDDVREDNRSIIYVRGSAFGPRGPESQEGGFDSGSFWARTGMQHQFTPPSAEWPLPLTPGFGDVAAGLNAAGAVGTALFRRERTGRPSLIDVSLLASGMWQLQPDIVNSRLGDNPAERIRPERYTFWNPLWMTYRTADGRFLSFMMLAPDRHWEDLCKRLGRPDLATDPRYADMTARRAYSQSCIETLEAVFAERDLTEWRKALSGFAGEWTIVQTPSEVHDDPQVVANGYIASVEAAKGVSIPLVTSPAQFDGLPGAPTRAPEYGEHTELVLLDLGYSWEDLIDLKDRHVII